MSLDLDDLKRIATQAVSNPFPTEGIREFLEQCNLTDPYYAFLYGLAKEMQPDLCVELGIELGRSLFAIATGSPSTLCVGVELSGKVPSTWQQFLGQCPNIKIVCGTTTRDWLLMNRNRKIGMLHVDADHEYRSVLEDVCLAIPLMEPGGVIAMDDICHDGPRRVWEMLALPKVSFNTTDRCVLHGENGFGLIIAS